MSEQAADYKDKFATVEQAIEDIKHGKMVVVVDDEDRENEGDLIVSAATVTPISWRNSPRA